MVGRCWRLLEESAAQTLEGHYGIHRDGRVEDEGAMGHLTDLPQEYRGQVLGHLRHIEAGGFKSADAAGQLIREIAYTHLNRVCAYKMMEKRKVIREAVSRGINSNGFKFYLADHPQDEQLWSGGQQDLAYRNFLLWLAGTVSNEIGVLFSPLDPANQVFPPQSVLDEVLEQVNCESLAGIWDEEETIGWIYQYFTPKEQREKARQESAAPRNSYKLAFRNQFFTPQYVVEFLVDNTLGRIWFEMRRGETALRERCRYLVWRKHTVFLQEGEQEPEPWESSEDRGSIMEINEMWTRPDPNQVDLEYMFLYALTLDGYGYASEHFGVECGDLANERSMRYGETGKWDGSFEELRCCLFFEQRRWRHFGEDPVGDALTAIVALYDATCERWDLEVEHVRHRPKRDPREIAILDPACGSGHFLLYCFDLLECVYEEAWHDRELGPALQREYGTWGAFNRAVPTLIVERNLHGIDIDPRAVQIASLALWLRALTAYQERGLRPEERPRITRSHLVTAEPMPGEWSMLGEFVAGVQPPVLGQLVHEIFEEMALASEAGSLLKVEEALRRRIAAAKAQWEAEPQVEQLALFGGSRPVQAQLGYDLSGITDTQFWSEAESRILEALEQYAREVSDVRRSLFAQDAERSFAFIDLCRRKFDVVLMNPPFGDASKPSKTYIEKMYPRTKNDLYAAFVERGLHWLRRRGILGAITSRTGFFLTSFQKWREEIVLTEARPTVVADLGQGILDTAMVETAAYCLEITP